MDPEYAPLCISIKTRETDFGSEVVVEDDGQGFESDADTPHIALANIRQRLEIMCGGKLTISPREGGGTAVTVTTALLNVDVITVKMLCPALLAGQYGLYSLFTYSNLIFVLNLLSPNEIGSNDIFSSVWTALISLNLNFL